MTDIELAEAVAKKLGTKPPHEYLMQRLIPVPCKWCQKEVPTGPCYARLLSDLNWAIKLLEKLPEGWYWEFCEAPDTLSKYYANFGFFRNDGQGCVWRKGHEIGFDALKDLPRIIVRGVARVLEIEK